MYKGSVSFWVRVVVDLIFYVSKYGMDYYTLVSLAEFPGGKDGVTDGLKTRTLLQEFRIIV